MDAERAAQDEDALVRVLRGDDLGWIARDLGLTVAQVRTALGRALTARGIPTHASLDARIEVARIDRMIATLWPMASYDHDKIKANGDPVELDTKAIAEVVRLQERREQLIRPSRYAKPLRTAFDQAIAACKTTDADAAIIAAGRTIAERVDEATATGQGQEVTKALYLVPHLVNVLRELEATPAARSALKNATGQGEQAGGRLAGMRRSAPTSGTLRAVQ